MRLLVIAALVGVGCGHAAPASTETGASHATGSARFVVSDAPPKLEDDPVRLATLSTQMFQAIARLLAEPTTPSECATVATKLDALARDEAEVIEANAHVLHAGHQKIQALKSALEPHQADLDTAAQTIGASPALKSCSNDATFARAIDRLIGEP